MSRHEPLAGRVFGIETEYGIHATDATGHTIDPGIAARELFQPIVEEFGAANIFHHNGSRLYIDVGDHPEWATAECSTLTQLLAIDQAGDRILADLAARLRQRPDSCITGGKLAILKNNIDARGNSYGCHENYLVSRETVLKQLSATLTPLLLTRQLICGAGMLDSSAIPLGRPQPTSSSWLVSQRADHVWESVSSATTRSRPIINTRDEPHCDGGRWRRLHVIVGDSNISEISTVLKVGIMILALELIEHDLAPHGMLYHGPVNLLGDIARDPTGSTVLTFDDGTQLTALEVQQQWCQAASSWLNNRPDPADQQAPTNAELTQVVSWWQSIITALEHHKPETVSHLVDWIAKRTLLAAYRRRWDIAPDAYDPRLNQLDFAYHDIASTPTIGSMLTRSSALATVIDEATIQAAIHTAPATTRATIRAELLDHARANDIALQADWSLLRTNYPTSTTVSLPDPLATSSGEAAALIAAWQQHESHS
ncbi:proteasome accessory factor PafA2 family protein [Corynebacterium choanae]|uniref:Pup--protein ligase n=1 Tax=Corynebacterium choanae TaxID=1862358 RepID=A0A3G6J6I7_9CORY|nr:proteasome accessory factor PafA2 family protein [Corynebacterium choanae]AZA13566.1 Pup--protein ligase [Corynebacterium choanae]